jgi:hypothetical protein
MIPRPEKLSRLEWAGSRRGAVSVLRLPKRRRGLRCGRICFDTGMSESSKTGGELFIVDNSDEAWKGLKYLQDWTEIASAFDIATGYFEIGALLALDGKWQKLDKIRILMGNEVSARTRKAILDALTPDVGQLRSIKSFPSLVK